MDGDRGGGRRMRGEERGRKKEREWREREGKGRGEERGREGERAIGMKRGRASCLMT